MQHYSEDETTDLPSLKPLFRYPGGKQADLPYYEILIPSDIATYVEPFVGGGATFFHLNHPGENVIGDVNPEVVNFYEQIRDGHGTTLRDMASLLPNTEDNYLHVRDDLDCEGSPLREALRFFYLRQTCFRGIDQRDREGHFNTAWNRVSNARPVNAERLADPSYEKLLGRTDVQLASFEDTMAEHDEPEDFVFLDPPYDGKDIYSSDFGTKEHERLAETFADARSRCLMVVSDTELMRELYREWIADSYRRRYNMKRTRRGGRADHLIVCNY
jgi:DNA adenine methylase